MHSDVVPDFGLQVPALREIGAATAAMLEANRELRELILTNPAMVRSGGQNPVKNEPGEVL